MGIEEGKEDIVELAGREDGSTDEDVTKLWREETSIFCERTNGDARLYE